MSFLSGVQQHITILGNWVGNLDHFLEICGSYGGFVSMKLAILCYLWKSAVPIYTFVFLILFICNFSVFCFCFFFNQSSQGLFLLFFLKKLTFAFVDQYLLHMCGVSVCILLFLQIDKYVYVLAQVLQKNRTRMCLQVPPAFRMFILNH